MIVQGQLPTNKIYEDSNFIAALEIRPANPGHVILFPKEHFKSILDMPANLAEEFLGLSARIAKSISKVSEGVTIIHSSGEATSNVLEHLVTNIIPRFSGDNLTFAWNPKQIDEEQMKKLAESISGAIESPEEKTPEVKEIQDEEGPSYEELEKQLPQRNS